MSPKGNCILYFVVLHLLSFLVYCISNGSAEVELRCAVQKHRSKRFLINLPSWFPWSWKSTKSEGPIELCFDGLGCFFHQKPWTSTLRPFPAPWTPNHINASIYLFTRSSGKGEKINLWPSVITEGTYFNSTRPKTVILTHGFASHGSEEWLHELKDVYLEKEDTNFFIVDWGNGAQHVNYFQVASNTRIVGAEVGRLLEHLVLTKGTKPSKIHMIGHSLGSHIVSYAAKEVSEYMYIGRITALDPAQPGFELQTDIVRLSKDDAEFVDVIHSDAKPIIPFFGFGMMMPVGDVDFYVNGGTMQPGCLSLKPPHIKSVKDLFSYPVEVIAKFVTCSHSRAYEYFINSLRNDDCILWGSKMNVLQNFLAVTSLGKLKLSNPNVKSIDDCTIHSCSFMGLDTPIYPARGSFMVTTTSEAPFCSKYYI